MVPISGATAACTRGLVAVSPGSSTVPLTDTRHGLKPCPGLPNATRPSAISLATARPFGPWAASSSGVLIGRSGSRPGEASSCAMPPSMSTGSPRSSPRTWSRWRRMASHDQRLLAHRDAAREAGAECHHHAARRDVLERGDGRGLRHRVAVARGQHRWTDTDTLGALGDTGEMHPDVVAEGRDLRRPNALVAELLREDGMVERLRARRQAEGVGQRHFPSMRFAVRAS